MKVAVYEESLNPSVDNWGWGGLYLLDSEDIAFVGKKSVHSQVKTCAMRAVHKHIHGYTLFHCCLIPTHVQRMSCLLKYHHVFPFPLPPLS